MTITKKLTTLVFFLFCNNACDDSTLSPDKKNEAASQALIEQCVPDEGYDDCIIVEDNEDFLHPTDIDAPWRSNHEGPNNSQIIEMDAELINGGLLPHHENQGYYESEEHFLYHLSLILGTQVASPNETTTFGTIIQSGSTIKDVGDPTNPNEFGGKTSGNLICDAITNSDGEIWISGQLVTSKCSKNYALDYRSPNTNNYRTTLSELTLSEGKEQVDFNAFKTNLFVYKSIGSEFDNYKKNGKGCYWKWNYSWFGISRTKICNKADMFITNTYYHNDNMVLDPGYRLFTKTAKNTTDSLSLKEWWVGAGICVDDYGNSKPCGGANTGLVNTVCARGTAGGLNGEVGTNNSCQTILF